VARVFQSEVLPRSAAIERLINAIAISDVAANASLSRAHIEDVVVGSRDRDAADGSNRLAVKQRLPAYPGVRGFSILHRGGAEVEHVRLTGHAGDGQGASAAEGPDLRQRRALNRFSSTCGAAGIAAGWNDDPRLLVPFLILLC